MVPIYKNVNKLNGIIWLGKGKIDNLCRSNVVYKIRCKTCPSKYIGQSKRCLQKRKKEHERAVRNNDNKSVLATHAFTQSHEKNFNKISVLATEKN